MSEESWVIITDERRVGGMYAVAAAISESVVAIVVGTAQLAEAVAGAGFSKVVLFETADGIPVEALAANVASRAAADQPQLIVTSDVATSRVIAGAAGGAISAAVIGDVVAIKTESDAFVLSSETANRKAIEDVRVAGPVLAIYTGADADVIPNDAAPIENTVISPTSDKIIGFAEPVGAGLATAQRVVAVGMGIGSRDNLSITNDLTEALGAYPACSLPVSEDMHWFEAEHVVGSSHNTTAPELYIAVGISGSPNHTSGFRDSKVVVAINNDPQAEIFNVSKYGIVGDLEKIVPALTAAIKG